MKTAAAHTVPVTRRGFVQSGVLGLTALSAGRVFGANERINVGLIGFGLIGRFHLAALKEQPDVRIAAVCDAHRGRVEAAAAMAGGEVARYGDFRKLLDSRDVDAVVVAKQVVGDQEANARLVRPYRAPWDKELQALGVA
jgi:predicted homoserine dehydrogenase-like protein